MSSPRQIFVTFSRWIFVRHHHHHDNFTYIHRNIFCPLAYFVRQYDYNQSSWKFHSSRHKSRNLLGILVQLSYLVINMHIKRIQMKNRSSKPLTKHIITNDSLNQRTRTVYSSRYISGCFFFDTGCFGVTCLRGFHISERRTPVCLFTLFSTFFNSVYIRDTPCGQISSPNVIVLHVATRSWKYNDDNTNNNTAYVALFINI